MTENKTNKKKPMISKPIIIFIVVVGIIMLLFELLSSPSMFSESPVASIHRLNTTIKYENQLVSTRKDTYTELKGDYCKELFSIQELEKLKINSYNIIDLKQCKNIFAKSYDESPIQISPISNMQVARISPKTILLRDGRVLIIGGDGNKQDSVEIFDPNLNTFELIANDISKYYRLPKRHFFDEPFLSFKEPKVYFTEPILLPTGKVFYLGAVFNPQTNTFTKANSDLSKQLLNFALNINSKKHYKDTNLVPLQVYQDGKTLFVKCNEVSPDFYTLSNCTTAYLEDPILESNYKYGLFESQKNKPILGATYINNSTIIFKYLFWSQLNNINNTSNIESYNPINGSTKLFNYFNNKAIFDLLPINKDKIIVLEKGLNYLSLYSLNLNSLNILELDKIPFNLTNYELNYAKDLYFLQVGAKPYEETSYKLTALSENLLLTQYNHLLIVFNVKNKTKNIIYDYNISPIQPITKLKDGRFLVIGSSSYNENFSKQNRPDSRYYRLNYNKYASIITIK